MLTATWATQPKAFGFFHIFGIVMMLVSTALGVIVGKKYKNSSRFENRDKFVWICGLVMLGVEIFKEAFLAIMGGGYQWNMFPIQICSIPLLLLPFFPLYKNNKIKTGVLGCISFVAMTGGAFYFVKPTAALVTPYIIISLQSFFWHWFLMFVGAFSIVVFDLVGEQRKGALIGGFLVFVVLSVVALIGNALFNNLWPKWGVNFFWINYADPDPFYPIMNLVFKSKSPYIVYYIAFLIYFGIGELFICGLASLIHKFTVKK